MSDKIKQIRRDKLNARLLTLADWCKERAAGDHKTNTTLSMLRHSVRDIEIKVQRAADSAIRAASNKWTTDGHINELEQQEKL